MGASIVESGPGAVNEGSGPSGSSESASCEGGRPGRRRAPAAPSPPPHLALSLARNLPEGNASVALRALLQRLAQRPSRYLSADWIRTLSLGVRRSSPRAACPQARASAS